MEENLTKESDDCSIELEKEEKRTKLNESLTMFDISPLKTHRVQKQTQISMVQKKLERNYENQEEVAAELENSTGSRVSERELVAKTTDLDHLLDAM